MQDINAGCLIMSVDSLTVKLSLESYGTCWNKGCFTSHLLSFDNSKVLKIINWIC